MLEDCSIGYSTLLDTAGVTAMVLQAVLVGILTLRSEDNVTLFGILFYKVEQKLCIAVATAIMAL